MNERQENKLHVNSQIQQARAQNAEALKEFADNQIKAQQLDSKHWRLINHIIEKNKYIEDQKTFDYAWSSLAMQAQEQPSDATIIVKGREIKYSDMDYMLAENLQMLCASQDPLAEYYDWVATEDKIEKEVTTDGTTISEWHDRNNFISFMDERETELKRIISLYSGVAFNPLCQEQAAAQAKLRELAFKLKELRRLRERAQNLRPERPKENLIIRNHSYENEDYDTAEQLRAERALRIARENYERQLDSSATQQITQPQKSPSIENLKRNKKLWIHLQTLSGRTAPNEHPNLTNPSQTRKKGFTQEAYISYLTQKKEFIND